MLILPLFFTSPASEHEKCPSCGCVEEKTTICKNCKHEYSDESDALHPVAVVFVFAIAVALCVFTLITLMQWFAGRDTLISVIGDNLAWVWSKLKTVF